MDRGSSKHSPRIDDQMRKETEALEQGSPVEPRASESRQMEPAGEHEPVIRSRPHLSDESLREGVLSGAEVDERSELARYLVRRPLFPARRWTLVSTAIQQNAPEELVRKLEDLPDGTFKSFEDVWEALGGQLERRAG